MVHCVVVHVLWFTVSWFTCCGSLCCGSRVVVHVLWFTVSWLLYCGSLCCGYRVVAERPKPSWTKRHLGLGTRLKLGQNLSEMEASTFARIKKVIWDQLLATKAEIINGKLYFRFVCENPKRHVFE